jgi:hypothetical protein
MKMRSWTIQAIQNAVVRLGGSGTAIQIRNESGFSEDSVHKAAKDGNLEEIIVGCRTGYVGRGKVYGLPSDKNVTAKNNHK